MIDLNAFEKGLEKIGYKFTAFGNTFTNEAPAKGNKNKSAKGATKAENDIKSVGSTLAEGKGTMSRNLRAWVKRNPVKSVAGGVLAGAGLGAMIFSQGSKNEEQM